MVVTPAAVEPAKHSAETLVIHLALIDDGRKQVIYRVPGPVLHLYSDLALGLD